MKSLTDGHAPPPPVEEVFEEHYLVLLLGRFRGFRGVTGRAMRCSRGKSTGTLRRCAWEPAKRSAMVWNRFRTVRADRFPGLDCWSG